MSAMCQIFEAFAGDELLVEQVDSYSRGLVRLAALHRAKPYIDFSLWHPKAGMIAWYSPAGRLIENERAIKRAGVKR